MLTLYLLRHAKSSWKDRARSDFDRPLSSRGKRDAPAMGRRMLAAGVRPDVIVTSPAKRALKTAKIVAEALHVPAARLHVEPRLYLAGVDELLTLVAALPGDVTRVMLVGHNPGFTDLVNTLAGRPALANLPTAGVATLRFRARSWARAAAAKATLADVDFPKRAAEA